MQKSRERLEWVDIAKGFGIFLVVVGHVIRGLYNSHVLPEQGVHQEIDAYIYSFHMPLFFWLSGLFAPKRLDMPWKAFLGTLLRTVAYPYLVWSALQTTVQIVLSGSTNSTVSWNQLLMLPVVPVMQFWFLYVLFLVSILYRALGGILGPRNASLVMILLPLAGSLLPGGLWSVLYQTVNNVHYYALGTLMLGAVSEGLKKVSPPLAGTWGMAGLVALAFVGSVELPVLIPAALGSASVVLISSACAPLFLSKWITDWGQRSLQIYVAHTLASAGVRIALLKLSIRDPITHLILGTVAGIAFPLVLAHLAERWGVEYVFQWPKKSASKSSEEGASVSGVPIR